MKKVLYGSLIFYIFLIPLPHVTALSEISFYLAVLCAALLFAGRVLTLRIRTPLIVPMLVFALWAILSSFWAADVGENLDSVYQHVIKMIVLYVLLVSVFNGPEDFRRILWVMVLSVAAFALYAIIQDYIILGHSPFTYRLHPDPQINTNRMGHFCVVAFFLGVSLLQEEKVPVNRTILFFALFTLLSGIILTHSRTAFIATIGGFIVLAWHHRRMALAGLAVLAVILIFLFAFVPTIWLAKFNDLLKGNDPRVPIYATYFNMAGERPLTGYGFEANLKKNWKRNNDKLPLSFRMEKAAQRPHDFLLDLEVRLGIVGVLIYCWLLVEAGRIGFHLARRGKGEFRGRQGLGVLAAFIALYTAGLVGNIFHIKTEMIMFTLMALLTILSYQKSADQNDPERSKNFRL